ncbi:hypothetical protein BAE46_09705 [Glaciecola punicea]|uniref:hypothetical protein n=1 Tax=Glaciecola punicea TaxID=56804 RepID=UPI000872E77E|nr:hypothetical protein [Glaciecola punicea]OFA30923.1 hypothetical protein BAE46_09705 [Glaciecola punicea]
MYLGYSTSVDYLSGEAAITRSILQNPFEKFEKFERKCFMYHTKYLNKIAFDPVLLDSFKPDDFDLIRKQMLSDKKDYFIKHLGVDAFSSNAPVTNSQGHTGAVKTRLKTI